MGKIDFDSVPDVKSFAPLPDGTYTCRLTDVEKSTSKSGDEMWNCTCSVLDDPYTGQLLWDRLTFNRKGNERIKLLCESLGLNVAARTELEPAEILGGVCAVTVYVEEYVASDGTTKKRNKVKFDGYGPADSNDSRKDLPF